MFNSGGYLFSIRVFVVQRFWVFSNISGMQGRGECCTRRGMGGEEPWGRLLEQSNVPTIADLAHIKAMD